MFRAPVLINFDVGNGRALESSGRFLCRCVHPDNDRKGNIAMGGPEGPSNRGFWMGAFRANIGCKMMAVLGPSGQFWGCIGAVLGVVLEPNWAVLGRGFFRLAPHPPTPYFERSL